MNLKKDYFDQIYDKKLMTPPWAAWKMQVFKKLYTLSARGYAGTPQVLANTDKTSHSMQLIPPLERHGEWLVKRQRLLGYCTDADERDFLAKCTTWNVNILQLIDAGQLNFNFTRKALNAALLDICRKLKGGTQ